MEDRYINWSFFYSTFLLRIKAGFQTVVQLFRLILLEKRKRNNSQNCTNASTLDIAVSGTGVELRVPAG